MVWQTVSLCCLDILNAFLVYVADPLSSWSADECANFVSGLRQYGKDFYQIHQNKVLTMLFTCICLMSRNVFTVVFNLWQMAKQMVKERQGQTA